MVSVSAPDAAALLFASFGKTSEREGCGFFLLDAGTPFAFRGGVPFRSMVCPVGLTPYSSDRPSAEFRWVDVATVKFSEQEFRLPDSRAASCQQHVPDNKIDIDRRTHFPILRGYPSAATQYVEHECRCSSVPGNRGPVCLPSSGFSEAADWSDSYALPILP